MVGFEFFFQTLLKFFNSQDLSAVGIRKWVFLIFIEPTILTDLLPDFHKLGDQMNEYFKLDFPTKNTIFRSVQEYVNANTLVNDLDFDKISVFFYLYISLTSFFALVQLLLRLTLIAYRRRRTQWPFDFGDELWSTSRLKTSKLSPFSESYKVGLKFITSFAYTTSWTSI